MDGVNQLRQRTLEKIQSLIEISVDGARNCEEAARRASHQVSVARLFADLANLRRDHLQELLSCVSTDEVEQDEAFQPGRMLWLWRGLRAAIHCGDPVVMLIEAERGEDRLEADYEQAVRETSGSPLGAVLRRQLLQVKAGHQRLRDLRDALLEG